MNSDTNLSQLMIAFITSNTPKHPCGKLCMGSIKRITELLKHKIPA
jgi:hypothetical protein